MNTAQGAFPTLNLKMLLWLMMELDICETCWMELFIMFAQLKQWEPQTLWKALPQIHYTALPSHFNKFKHPNTPWFSETAKGVPKHNCTSQQFYLSFFITEILWMAYEFTMQLWVPAAVSLLFAWCGNSKSWLSRRCYKHGLSHPKESLHIFTVSFSYFSFL